MTTGLVVLGWDFPSPISWAWDRITGFVGDVATDAFELMVGGLVAWATDAVTWVVGGVFDYFLDAEDPNVQADWFVTGQGPYATTATIGATLMVGFLLAGIAQGVLAGDLAGMLRRMALDLPVSVLGIVGLVTVTQALIRLTDQLSTWVMSNFEDDIADFTAVLLSLSHLGGGPSTALVVLILALVTVLAGLILVAELAVRAALIYIVVALAPLVFAAQLWPALKGIGQKLLRLLCGLILAKLAMAVALSVAAAAAVGTGSGGEVEALPEPEVFAEDPSGSVTQAVGILLAAAAAFGVAAFMPFFVVKLLPIAEDGAIGQGLRGAPMRAAQQGLSFLYYGQMIPRMASGWGRGGRPPWPSSSPSRGREPPDGAPDGRRARRPGPRPGGASHAKTTGTSGSRPAAGGASGSAAAGGSASGAAAAGPAGVAAGAAKAGARAATGAARRGVQGGTEAASSAVGEPTSAAVPARSSSERARRVSQGDPRRPAGRASAPTAQPPRRPDPRPGGGQ